MLYLLIIIIYIKNKKMLITKVILVQNMEYEKQISSIYCFNF